MAYSWQLMVAGSLAGITEGWLVRTLLRRRLLDGRA